MSDLPPPRQAEISDWPDDRDRHRSLIASRLLIAGLVGLGYTANALASLRYRPQSRPALDLPVDFSISHSDGRIVCAVSCCGSVGVDVERLGRMVARDFRLYLSEAERMWSGRSARRFYEVWTRKEAVVKAAGSGGLRDLARVDTTLAPDLCELDGRHWRTTSIPVGRDHVAHLALSDECGEVTFRSMSRLALERDGQAIAGARAGKTRAVL